MPRPVLAGLFPSGTGDRPNIIVEGILRAPRRGRAPAPWLSADRVDPPVLAGHGWEDASLVARAAAGRHAMVEARAGGEWWQPDVADRLPDRERYAIVLWDEPALAGGRLQPGIALAQAMLARALAEHPRDRIVVVTPPRPTVRQLDAAAREAVVVRGPRDPWALIERACALYTAGGETGLLALLADVPVTACAPAPYAGWGVTTDAEGIEQRPQSRSIDEIFADFCLVSAAYRDPFYDGVTSFEAALAIVRDWRRVEEANRGIAVCVGMSFWKRRRVADFVRRSDGIPPFRRDVAGALAACRGGRAIAGWASRLPDGLPEAALQNGVPLIRVEDGFIRSVGLGSDFLPPASLVFDSRAMYYDPRGDSDLAVLLRETEFPADLLQRAARLIELLVARGITKYNLADPGVGLAPPPGRRRILVPGQVEDDLSIRFGAGMIRTNLDLLAGVRADNPDAFVIYKPHPDVVAGHRVGAVPEAEARRFADIVIDRGSTAALLGDIDELHTMTSLAGFEALLRGRRVVVYGRPFYAGWGLTDDRPRFERGRKLTLAELVAGALILYPRYLDPLTRLPCGPEVIIERLDHPELWRAGPLVAARRLQGRIARAVSEVRARLSLAGIPPVRRLDERSGP